MLLLLQFVLEAGEFQQLKMTLERRNIITHCMLI